MKNILLVILKWILTLIEISIGILALFLLYMALTDYVPDKMETLEINGYSTSDMPNDSVFRFITWNLGYGGLGKEMDFFYDGGEKARPTKDWHEAYVNGINRFLTNQKNIDFFLLQEVDLDSKRTYGFNQAENLANTLSNYYNCVAINYDVAFVPMPIQHPMGKVKAGMMTFSKHRPVVSYRYSLPQVYGWPMKYFMLDRAVILNVYTLSNGKELVVMNVHNSAYVEDAEARKKELTLIKELANKEYRKGNYVIIGGDWNQNPPLFSADKIQNGVALSYQLSADLFGNDWKWGFDPNAPTNRFLNKPYDNQTKTTLIDYFVVSPNVEITQVQTQRLYFENSDHEPVMLEIKLR